MAFEVEFTPEFGTWWDDLSGDEQESVAFSVRLLEERGVHLRRPHADAIHGSQFVNMRELRCQHEGKPYRILYAFDPRRVALLLLGGDKTGNARWYEEFVPRAEKLYAKHLADLGIEREEEQ